MDTTIRPHWTTVVLVALPLIAAVTLALTGYPEHVDALIAGALGLLVPTRGRVMP